MYLVISGFWIFVFVFVFLVGIHTERLTLQEHAVPTQRTFWVLQILQKIQSMQEREVLYHLEQ